MWSVAMKRLHEAFTRRNTLPKIERDVAESKHIPDTRNMITKRVMEITITRNGKEVPIKFERGQDERN